MTPTRTRIPTDRPAELAAWLIAAPAVLGFLVDAGVAVAIAAPVAAALGFVPLALSTLRDARREPDDPGDNVVESLPIVIQPQHEHAELTHDDGHRES